MARAAQRADKHRLIVHVANFELRQLKIHSFKFDKFGAVNLMVVLHQILIDETLKFPRVCVENV